MARRAGFGGSLGSSLNLRRVAPIATCRRCGCGARRRGRTIGLGRRSRRFARGRSARRRRGGWRLPVSHRWRGGLAGGPDRGHDAIDRNGFAFLDRDLERVPAAGEGISASTLSVEISKSGSSRSTVSPIFLIHRTMVPSAIDSPIWGITTGVDISSISHVDGRQSTVGVHS